MKKVGMLMLAVSLTAACDSAPKFSPADVQKTEADIRAKFEEKGAIVEQVSMIRDSDRHMSGFAKMQVKQVGLLHTKLIEVNKNCTATMDETTRQFIWECK